MSRLTCFLNFTLLLLITASAQISEQQINALGSEDYPTRVSTQNNIIATAQNNDKSLEYVIYTMLHRYSHTSNPEIKYRTLTIMQSISTPYRESLKKPTIGLKIKNHLVRINEKSIAMLEVLAVRKGYPADSAGILKGDKILSFGGTSFASHQDTAVDKFDEKLLTYFPNEKVEVEIRRESKNIKLAVRLESATFNKKTNLSEQDLKIFYFV